MTPKQRFLQRTDDVKMLAGLAYSTPFLNTLDSALLQYESTMATSDVTAAASNYCKIVGAREFIKTLLDLPFMPTAQDRPDRGNLKIIS